ncbi:MAG: protein kinase, partial [Planctomycetes bacterium]|nr:protein kinase [Planctomycetota bacterium]
LESLHFGIYCLMKDIFMNNQICYRMLFESGMMQTDELRECYIDTFKNPQYSEHKDLAKVVLDKKYLNQDQFDEILVSFLNSSEKELLTLDKETSDEDSDEIEEKIRATNVDIETKLRNQEKSDLTSKKTMIKDYDIDDNENINNPLEQVEEDDFKPYMNKKTILQIKRENSGFRASENKRDGRDENLVLGSCLLKKKIGEGSVGQVWLASHKKLSFEIAVKILNKKSTTNKKLLKRFYFEGQLASRLNHPNIIHVYEIDKHGEIHFIVMQYVDGKTLSENNKSDDVTLKEQVSSILQTLDGLHYAHVRNIVHRDIKLENLMVDAQGVVKITDFGFSKHIGSSNITVSGDVFGTPYYMPPEQWEDSRATDQQADIYATGVCLYKLISGQYPIDGESPVHIFKKMMAGKRSKIRQFTPDIDIELEQIIETAISLRRENRFKTSMEFGRKLAEYARMKNWLEIVPKIFSKKAEQEDIKNQETQELVKKKSQAKHKNIKVVKNFNKTLMIHCEQKLDGVSLEEIEKFIAPMIRRDKVQYIIFDISKVIKITSLGFATILRINELLLKRGGSIFLLKPTKQASIMLNMMSVETLVPIFTKISELKDYLKQG